MANTPQPLLDEIEEFLSETEMGASYFGKVSAGNSELVARLRAGRRIWPETEAKVRSFMIASRKGIRNSGHVGDCRSRQPLTGKKSARAS